MTFSDMKNRTTAGIFYLDSLTVYDYYPYGMHKPDRYYEDAWSRYGFNGMEKDDDIKGKGNSYDFGARVYDPRTVRFYSIDPKEKEYPWQSGYVAFDNSPILKTDPDGMSATAKIVGNKIIVSANLVFYGDKADNKVAKASAKEIQKMYNEPKAMVTVNGKQYQVEFKITYKVVTIDKAVKMAKKNTSAKNNFIRVEDTKASTNSPENVSEWGSLGSNDGYFVTTDNLGTSTTAAHEIGHSCGLEHPEKVPIGGGYEGIDVRGNPEPGIMPPRGSLVDAPFTYDPTKGASTFDPSIGKSSNTINPIKRKVSQEDIIKMFTGVSFDSKGKATIGDSTPGNQIFTNKSMQSRTPASTIP